MKNHKVKWEIVNKIKNQKSKIKIDEITNVLLENRGIRTSKQKEEFFNPTHPENLEVKDLGISDSELKKSIERIKKAVKDNEQIIIYGDYDADGICATAILWEVLYNLTKNVRPYIPDRFEEGYGINAKSVEKIKIQNPNVKLIVTVDNGIVAANAVNAAKGLNIDVIVTDHHQKEKKRPEAYAIIHTDKISGAGVSWILAREIVKKIQNPNSKFQIENGLELVAVGTIADQMPLLGPNRSFVKYGLEALNKTKRRGLLALFQESGIDNDKTLPRNATARQSRLRNATARQVGTYEVNYIIAPRLNAMGRLEHAIDSLRLLCTKSSVKAKELADILGKTNRQRQSIVDGVVLHAMEIAKKKLWKGVIVLAHESYHEGVIGLAASKLVEEFGRPAIVLSKGKKISKASARSISGFNIIESIRSLDHLTNGGGGHPMAAGFSIETEKINLFINEYEKLTKPLLIGEILTKKIKLDMEIGLDSLSQDLAKELEKFEPTGIGNFAPLFMTRRASVVSARTVGSEGKHLKLVFEEEGLIYNAIAFGKGDYNSKLKPGSKIDIAYNITLNTWNGNTDLQLKIKDLKPI